MEATSLTRHTALHSTEVTPQELEYLAFSGQQEITHGIFRSISEEGRRSYVNKYILSEVTAGGINKLRKFLSASAEEPAQEEKEFIDSTIHMFIEEFQRTGTYPRELFLSILNWGDELVRLSLLQEALQYFEKAVILGIRKYPDLYVRVLLCKAHVMNLLGSYREVQSVLDSLASQPYIITDRNLVPEVFFSLGKESLLKGNIVQYKKLLFRGLGLFYTRLENRKLFVDQIRKTFRHSHKVLLDDQVSFADKILFLVHRIYFIAERIRPLNILGMARALRLGVFAYVYFLNYVVRYNRGKVNVATTTPLRLTSERTRMLITRAMGGIGDLLMMTPGIHQYKLRHPHRQISLAIPKRYFPVFEGNPDVTLVDIENDQVQYLEYRHWFNFTDCPASRVEARTSPRVKQSRTTIFARALGAGPMTLRSMDKRPRYFVSRDERAFKVGFWSAHKLGTRKVIGVQLRADESYRDYPHMERLVDALTRDHDVLLFDAERIKGFDFQHVIKIDNLSIRKAFALASGCDAIIAPDSSFVHLAAAFDIPCVALYGPIDGKVRTGHYPKCRYLDVRHKLGCMPCWRNEQIPCRLTNMRASVCMADISTDEILKALNDILQQYQEDPHDQ